MAEVDRSCKIVKFTPVDRFFPPTWLSLVLQSMQLQYRVVRHSNHSWFTKIFIENYALVLDAQG